MGGLALEHDGGWLYGLLSGLALGMWLRANTQIAKLEKDLATLSGHFFELARFIEKTQGSLRQNLDKENSDVTPAAESSAAAFKPTQAADIEIPDSLSAAPDYAATTLDPQYEPQQPAAAQSIPATPHQPGATARLPDSAGPEILWMDNAAAWLKHFFTTGNVLVKVGVLVLFFGIAFLVKFAADNNVFPIELRLAGVGLAGVVMLVLGWRLKDTKTSYALVLQGGALGVLYLTVFAALRLYSLLPATLAFSILFVFAAFSAALAVMQNSRALAVLGISGGFLAPILTSTGSGSHVGLFSYYLILNLGIFAIAWFRSWRLLNVVGFMFTFVVATTWGVKYYTPEFFATTEPFLVAFYLLYVGIAVLFAFKQPVQLKGYVDSTLVFGVPLVGFGLQAGMVSHIEYALAWSSLALAALYIGLASVLWQRLRPDSRLLCEAFVAIGIMFATLAVPFALDARWTAGTWALEGAAAVWVGSRQSRMLPRLLGYALQLAGGFAYLVSLNDPQDYQNFTSEIFILNGQYIGALIVASSGLFVAWRLSLLTTQASASATGIQQLKQREPLLSVPFLIWGLVWWYGAGISEIADKIQSQNQPLSLMLFFSFSVVTTQWFKQKLGWSQLRLPALALLPALYLLLPLVLIENEHPFGDWNLAGWFAALAAYFWILKQNDDDQSKGINVLHMAGFWLIVLILGIEATWQVNEFVSGADTWWLIMTGLVPVILMMLMYRYGHNILWPVGTHRKLYQVSATLPIGMGVWIWFVLMNLFSDGDAAPLMYLPLLNPLDITLAIQLLALIYWLRFPLSIETWGERRWRFEYSQIALALSVFLWLNTIWLRTAHHIWHIPFESQDMMHSGLVQAGVSLLWGITGLLCMVYGARKLKRHVWIAGAVVMAAVVVKLFLFDLENSGTVARIVSFISVGVLFLVVGYFAPVPPAMQGPGTEKEADSEQ